MATTLPGSSSRPAVPKYQKIAADLRTSIESGEYDGQLPTKAALMDTYGVALNTVERALDVLRHLGMVETRQGLGTFVISQSPDGDAGDDRRIADLEDRLAYVEAQLMDLYASQGKAYQAWSPGHQDREEAV